MDAISNLYAWCISVGCHCVRDAPMSEYTSFKIGGPADIVIVPDTKENLAATLIKCRELGVNKYIIGKGSNVLVPDEGLRGAVILTTRLDTIQLSVDGVLHCDAGASLSALCRFAHANTLTGLEFAYGIPGTVGGAVYMNAGAYGGEMKDVVLSCEHMDGYGNPGEFSCDNLHFDYRYSIYADSEFTITDIRLRLTPGSKEAIRLKMDEYLLLRTTKQPLDYPSAGSTFKRPEGCYAGKLIEDCGLKGKTVGHARVSEKHAGFIINEGGASANNVRDLIALVKETVFKNTGIVLETEIKML